MSVIMFLILLISKLNLTQLSIAHLTLSNVVICVIIYHSATRDQSYSIKSKYKQSYSDRSFRAGHYPYTLLMTSVKRSHLTPPTLSVTG